MKSARSIGSDTSPLHNQYAAAEETHKVQLACTISINHRVLVAHFYYRFTECLIKQSIRRIARNGIVSCCKTRFPSDLAHKELQEHRMITFLSCSPELGTHNLRWLKPGSVMATTPNRYFSVVDLSILISVGEIDT